MHRNILYTGSALIAVAATIAIVLFNFAAANAADEAAPGRIPSQQSIAFRGRMREVWEGASSVGPRCRPITKNLTSVANIHLLQCLP